jgi:hypothetical protein
LRQALGDEAIEHARIAVAGLHHPAAAVLVGGGQQRAFALAQAAG